MTDTQIHNTDTKYNAGLSSPHPAEAHRRAGGAVNQQREVFMNNSRVLMRFAGGRWVNFRVSK